MNADARLGELMRLWQESTQRGQSPRAEELCRDCPELLPSFREKLAALEKERGPEITTTLGGRTALTPRGDGTQPSIPALNLQAGHEPIAGYRLIKKLGQGGFGEVWKATGPGDIEVAMKFVPLAEHAGSVELEAFRLVKNIRHPNLLAIFGAWQEAGFLVVAMELAERTLLDRHDEAVAEGLLGIPRRELLRYTRDTAAVLDFLNKPRHFLNSKKPVGIQHCDIKPQNLLLLGGGVKVADFGLARMLERRSADHPGGLTPAYAAPELFQGQMSRTSDQYSLAVTYCHLRGGRLPFSGSVIELKDAHILHEPDLSMLPESERAIVQRALAKDPRERWPNCRTFIKALAEATRGAGIERLSSDVIPMGPRGSTFLAAGGESTAPFHPEADAGADEQAEHDAGTGLDEQFAWKTRPPAGARRRSPWNSSAIGAVVVAILLATALILTVREWLLPEEPMAQALRSEPLHEFETPDPGREVRKAKSQHQPSAGGVETVQPPSPVELGPSTKVTGDTKRVPGPIPPAAEPLGSRSQPSTRMYVTPSGPRTLTAEGIPPAPPSPLAAPTPSPAGESSPRLALPDTHPDWTGGPEAAEKADRRRVTESAVFGWQSYAAAGLAAAALVIVVASWLGLRRRIEKAKSVSPGSGIVKPLRRLQGHTDGVWSVACSPDGRLLASASLDGSVRVWDSADGHEVACLRGHGEGVTCAAFAPDGRRIASASLDNTVRIWDLASHREISVLTGHAAGVTSVAFAPDGRSLLTGGLDRAVRLWDGATGQEIRTFDGHQEVIWSVAFTPDGRRALSASGGQFQDAAGRGDDCRVRLWDLATGQELRRFEGHTAAVRSVAVSADGKTLASGSSDRTVRLWDIDTGQPRATLTGHTDWVRSVAFSPDGHHLLSAGDDETLRYWEVDSGEELARLTGHTWSVTSVVFTPDGQHILSGSDDMSLAVWQRPEA